MLKQISAFLFLLLFATSGVRSQTVYQVNYRMNTNGDTTLYSAFLYKYNNGMNLVRINYTDPLSKKRITAATETKEFFLQDAEGKENTNILLLKVLNASDTGSGKPYPVSLPVFIFKPDANTGFYDPVGVSLSETSPVMANETFFKSEYYAPDKITRELVSNYFGKKEEFYANLFKPKARGSFKMNEEELKTRMYLLLVGDSNDETIGGHTVKDLDKVQTTFEEIRKYIGISDENYKTQIISGNDLSKQNVLNAIDKLKPRRTDIVVFFFSGHGMRVNEKDTFPYIKLKTQIRDSMDAFNNSLSMHNVFEMIKSKPSRLNIIMSDCCNISYGKEPIETLLPQARGGDNWSFNEKNIRDLFFNSKRITVVATAAKNGEASWSSPNLGGFFTHKFKATMQDYCSDSKNSVNWNTFMTELQLQSAQLASTKCCFCCKTGSPCGEKIFCKLNPVYYIPK